VPQTLTPLLASWVVMNSPSVLHEQTKSVLPLTHPNTCFGIEGIHVQAHDPEPIATAMGHLVERPSSGIQWKDLVNTEGKRIQAGERFFDAVKGQGREGVFMLTLKVTNIEELKVTCQKAGAKTTPCNNRDGFIVDGEFFGGGPAVRFVRNSWKRYFPTINDSFPSGRRTDLWRPLGGAYSTTLSDGFGDNWKY